MSMWGKWRDSGRQVTPGWDVDASDDRLADDSQGGEWGGADEVELEPAAPPAAPLGPEEPVAPVAPVVPAIDGDDEAVGWFDTGSRHRRAAHERAAAGAAPSDVPARLGSRRRPTVTPAWPRTERCSSPWAVDPPWRRPMAAPPAAVGASLADRLAEAPTTPSAPAPAGRETAGRHAATEVIPGSPAALPGARSLVSVDGRRAIGLDKVSDAWSTWRHTVEARAAAGEGPADLGADLETGARLLEGVAHRIAERSAPRPAGTGGSPGERTAPIELPPDLARAEGLVAAATALRDDARSLPDRLARALSDPVHQTMTEQPVREPVDGI